MIMGMGDVVRVCAGDAQCADSCSQRLVGGNPGVYREAKWRPWLTLQWVRSVCLMKM